MSSNNILQNVLFTYKKEEIDLSALTSSNCVGDVKNAIYTKFNIAPESQKLLGLRVKPGYSLSDEMLLEHVDTSRPSKVMIMGSQSSEIDTVKTAPQLACSSSSSSDAACSSYGSANKKLRNESYNNVDDEDEGDGSGPSKIFYELQREIREEMSDLHDYANNYIYLEKVEKRVDSYEICVVAPPRPGKALLVLDIDYTIFDNHSVAQSVFELCRPHLHEMLSAAYQHYDIAFWSATRMSWIRNKLFELGVLDLKRPGIAYCRAKDTPPPLTEKDEHDEGGANGTKQAQPYLQIEGARGPRRIELDNPAHPNYPIQQLLHQDQQDCATPSALPARSAEAATPPPPPPFKVCMLLDANAMITVFHVRKSRTCEVKPLHVIWRNFPELWSPANTIMVDDLERNFVMNPRSGLTIKPYKDYITRRAKDKELLKLKHYLEILVKSSESETNEGEEDEEGEEGRRRQPDFTQFDHANWKKLVKKSRKPAEKQ